MNRHEPTESPGLGLDLPEAPQSRVRGVALPRARPQIPAADLRRADRPGRDGQDARQRHRARPDRPCLPADRGARGRQDLDRAAGRQGAQLRRPGRAGRPDHRPVRRVRAVPGDRRGAAHRRDRDGRRHRTPASTTSARSSRRSATRRSARATRSTSSTKSTCCRRTLSMRLLKTLEEPPAHVKFLFATTEVDKVPVTVLSRCQRFDLRRIPADKLADAFRRRSRKAEGGRGRARGAGDDRPGRRGLGPRRPVDPRPGDRARRAAGSPPTRSATCSASPTAGASGGCSQRCWPATRRRRWPSSTKPMRSGSTPASLLRGLMEALHAVDPGQGRAPAPTRCSRPRSARRPQELAAQARLGRHPPPVADAAQGPAATSQIAPDPQEAATMALLRLIHAADLPDPAALLAQAVRARRGAPRPRAAPTARRRRRPPALPADFAALVELLEEQRQAAARRSSCTTRSGWSASRRRELVLKPLQAAWAPTGRATSPPPLKAGDRRPAGRCRLTDEGGEPSLLAAGEDGRGTGSRRSACRAQRPRGDGSVPRRRASKSFEPTKEAMTMPEPRTKS